jgi:hypothetical protein
MVFFCFFVFIVFVAQPLAHPFGHSHSRINDIIFLPGTPVAVAALEEKFWRGFVALVARECAGDAELETSARALCDAPPEVPLADLLDSHCAPHIPHKPLCRKLMAACIASRSAEQWGPVMGGWKGGGCIL